MATGSCMHDKPHSEKVRELFAAIASRYDLMNDVQSFGLHRRWKRRLAALARVGPGKRALDVCCGTGDVAFELAVRGAQVVGLDFNPAMLELAKRRARARDGLHSGICAGTPNPVFVLGDAQQLPFADNTFDAVTVSYGLRNLASWALGLVEMTRVVKVGGRVLVLDFGKPQNGFLRKLYFAYLGAVVPVLGKAICGDGFVHDYLLESLKRFPAQQGVAAKMRELGLAEVDTINIICGVMSITVGRKNANASTV